MKMGTRKTDCVFENGVQNIEVSDVSLSDSDMKYCSCMSHYFENVSTQDVLCY